ncbi:MAG: hypothetical protein EU541_04465 [Promethearchaeota archaeon]|nr:MAG: hypothetical protein EU541_04465 [Candidatus Lokiarchaeota archaeon]
MSKNKQDFECDINYNEKTGYIHNYCTSRGFPLGGLGTGGFSVFTDGGFGKFRTNHNWFQSIGKAEYPRGSFFGIWVKSKEKRIAKILRRTFQGGKEFSNVSSIHHTHFKGRIPFFNLKYEDKALPIQLELSGFTSLIPHNIKDSSLPIAFFQIKIKNPTGENMLNSVLFSFENILGIGGSGGSRFLLPLNGSVVYNSTEGNYGEKFELNDIEGIKFGTTQYYEGNNPRRRVIGQYYIYTDVEKNNKISISKCPSWDSNLDSPLLWNSFKEDGEVNLNKSSGNAGAFSIKFELQPKEEKKINFYLLWWTPYYVIEKKQRLRKVLGNHKGKDYGHYYLQHFSNPEDLIQYSVNERSRMEKETREIIEVIDQSNLPYWLKSYILNSTDSMLVNSVLTKRGDYYMIEGTPWDWPFGALTGTIDQRLVSHIYSYAFFPSLDRNELQGFFELTKNGKVPHGNGHADIALGTKHIPYGEPIKIFNRSEHWVDLPQSLILQVGKHIIQSKDIELLKEFWQKVPEIMQYLDETLRNSIPEGITTYDYKNYHPCFIYTAILHLATLRMVIYLAKLLKERIKKDNPNESRKLSKFIKKYQSQYQATDHSYQECLWMNEGYFKTCEQTDTVFTSALAGDWISRLCGLGPVVQYEKAIAHSKWQTKTLVNSHNYSIINEKKTRPLIYREADINGNEIPVRVLFRKKTKVNNPWQTLAYQAFESIYLNRIEDGLDIIKKIWEKGFYEGYPWDMDHWGWERNHIYMSHPVMWAVLNALSGVSYNGFEQKLMISPHLIPNKSELKIPIFFPDFWLMMNYSSKNGNTEFKVLKTFNSELTLSKIVYQKVDGKEEVHELEKKVKLKKGKRFSITLE